MLHGIGGLNEAWRQLNNSTKSDEAKFNYHIASLMLFLSSIAYWPEVVKASDSEEGSEERKSIHKWIAGIFGEDEFGTLSSHRTAAYGLCFRGNSITLIFKGTTPDCFGKFLY